MGKFYVIVLDWEMPISNEKQIFKLYHNLLNLKNTPHIMGIKTMSKKYIVQSFETAKGPFPTNLSQKLIIAEDFSHRALSNGEQHVLMWDKHPGYQHSVGKIWEKKHPIKAYIGPVLSKSNTYMAKWLDSC